MPKRADKGLGRPNEPPVLILTSLAEGEKHGYALTKDIAAFAGVELGPGTLYGAITRLEERGLIEPAEGDDARRRPYRITASGRTALADAVRDMRTLADEGARRLGLRVLVAPMPNPLSLRLGLLP
ncbi:MAG TPA: PadR family transcriptional regulator [Acidimicrobiales bacterium]|jgi:DNA-binding PadR family transcriptional regulator